MSRIGKKTIAIPTGVTVKVNDHQVIVKGPKGELNYTVPAAINVKVQEQTLSCVPSKQPKKYYPLWGTTRARLANMVKGVSEGFTKELELHGVGFKATVKSNDLELLVGYSHPVQIKAPRGITFSVNKELIKVEGADIVQVGQIAADIRQVRRPEPYQGKGIRYKGEHIRRKVGKVVGATEIK